MTKCGIENSELGMRRTNSEFLIVNSYFHNVPFGLLVLQRELDRVELEPRNQAVPVADADFAHLADLPALGEHARQAPCRSEPRLRKNHGKAEERVFLHELRGQPLVRVGGISLHRI